jgi:acyl carrier protein
MTTVMNGGPRASVYDAVVDVVADRTLYDPACLLPDSHLEGELGIDSVILESILAAIGARFGLTGGLPRTVSTIRDLA